MESKKSAEQECELKGLMQVEYMQVFIRDFMEKVNASFP
jgi:hypothetical protein